MKVLKDEAQTELQGLLEQLRDQEGSLSHAQVAELEYWAIELKPKRRKRIPAETT